MILTREKIEFSPPRWAVDAGVPEPYLDETFCDYVKRLGFNADWMLQELTDRTACLANVRLSTALMKTMPYEYDDYVTRICEERGIDRKRIEYMAFNLFGDRFRRPLGLVKLRP